MTKQEFAPREIPLETRKFISNTPALLSLLYDVDLLPEQIVTKNQAANMMTIVFAYKIWAQSK